MGLFGGSNWGSNLNLPIGTMPDAPSMGIPGGDVAPTAMPKRGGLFGSGFMSKLAQAGAILSDSPIAYNAAFGNQNAERDFNYQQQLALQKALASVQEHRANRLFDVQNPIPDSGTALMQNVAFLRAQGKNDLAEQMIQNAATAPPIVGHNPDGTLTVYPQGSVPRSVAPPTAPVGKLTPITGGPTQPASGGFRQFP